MAAHELQGLTEILAVSYTDLRRLLTCDHPPPNVHGLILKEKKTIEVVKYLITDISAQMACKELHKYKMNEYTVTQWKARMSI
jgi:hypothetical protein